MCSEAIAVMKKYFERDIKDCCHERDIIRRNTKRGLTSIKTRLGTTSTSASDTDTSIKVSFKVRELIASRWKPFSEGEFLKDCLTSFVDEVCPENKMDIENISLSQHSTTRRIEHMNQNTENQLEENVWQCVACSMALDESTSITDTAQLVIFIWPVTDELEVTEKLFNMCHLKGTATGKNIIDEVTKLFEKYKLSKNKLCGITFHNWYNWITE